MSKNFVTKHPVLTTLVVGSAVAGVVGARKAKEKVIKMKEDGTFEVLMFNCYVDNYLVQAKNEKLDLDDIKAILSLMDSIDEMRQTNEDFDFRMSVDEYSDLNDYLNKYINDIKISNGLNVEVLEKADEIGNLEYKFRQVLQTQRFILENYSN